MLQVMALRGAFQVRSWQQPRRVCEWSVIIRDNGVTGGEIEGDLQISVLDGEREISRFMINDWLAVGKIGRIPRK